MASETMQSSHKTRRATLPVALCARCCMRTPPRPLPMPGAQKPPTAMDTPGQEGALPPSGIV
eukprot:CAMPEP_0179295398 /NCGR_PEP_ID=MMETSP0797-20121207/44404_1 /TAXON_ID=47934 /ORGANISM="Dinophysis acuminata, Strain DAEP01" /LENGTH=61 /DNA_ID=CAMNT_0021004647 /DNA_START=185 /DNA_END=366 /DNA_ORIENTATION=-